MITIGVKLSLILKKKNVLIIIKTIIKLKLMITHTFHLLTNICKKMFNMLP